MDRSEDSEGLQPLQIEQVASGQMQLPVPWTRYRLPSELQPDVDETRKACMPCCAMLYAMLREQSDFIVAMVQFPADRSLQNQR